jgi:hypothetical protein
LRWPKGSASPSPGRPVGSRSKLGDAFVETLQKKWEAEGDSIIDRVARDNPEKIVEVTARVLPKELVVTVEQRGPMDSDTIRKMRRFVDLVPPAAEEDAVFEALELFMRSHFAVPVK